MNLGRRQQRRWATSRLGTRHHPASAAVALVTTIAFLATLFGAHPRRAEAAETNEPADTPNFSEATNGIRAGADIASSTRKAARARKAPVSAKGSFIHSLPIQVPPGRLGMTPSLALNYDSSSLAESPVGVGWSFGVGRISRSTRLGYPAVTVSDFTRTYDATRELFTSPSGELVPTTDAPAGSLQGFAPVRETSPIRYEFVRTEDRWVEHVPNGVKKYYGADPFDGRKMRIVNEVGTFSWLLVREEDPHGNYIKYDYHNATAQERSDRASAQVAPILRQVEWGGNRLAGQPSPFYVSTSIEGQAGPLNVLEGNALLTHRIKGIQVRVGAAQRWSYSLEYLTSNDTGRSLLRAFRRDVPSEATLFEYSEGAPGGERFQAMGDLHAGADDRFYTEGSYWYRGPFDYENKSFVNAIQAPGHRAGIKFIDVDGNGTTDAIYHAGGIGTTNTHVLWSESRLQEPSAAGLGNWMEPAYGSPTGPSVQPTTGLPYFPLNGDFLRPDFPAAALRQLVDMDGDGDADGIGFPTSFIAQNGAGAGVPLPPSHLAPPSAGLMSIRIHTNVARTSGVTLQNASVPWPRNVDFASVVFAAAEEDDGTIGPPTFEIERMSDVEVPAVDLNADGKMDVVLLKHRTNPVAWDPYGGLGHAYAVPPGSLLRMYSWLSQFYRTCTPAGCSPQMLSGFPGLPPVGDLMVNRDLEIDVADLARTGALIFVDRDLLMGSIAPRTYVRLDLTGSTAVIPEVMPPDRPVIFISDRLVLPHRTSPGGERPPVGPPETPEIQQYFQVKPWWWPRTDPEGDVYIPLRDNYYLGSGSFGAAAFFGEFHYVPRVYLMRGEANRALESEEDASTSEFERSLQHHLNKGSPNECRAGVCAYPAQANFNSFFVDLNGDGLPDLVKAAMPSLVTDGAGEKQLCPNGHEVLLNRGYTFESVQNSLASFEFGAAENAMSHPLRLVANRDRSCYSPRPRMEDSAIRKSNGGPWYPLSAMAQTDIDSDGRVDLVISYQPTASDPNLEQFVYLNTGRGFRSMSGAAFGLPADIAIARDIQYPHLPGSNAFQLNSREVGWPRDGLADTARFVDMDGDGLVDIVSAGVCSRQGLLTTNCQLPKWYRNKGDIPDRLRRVVQNSGAWTTVDYAGPKSGIVTVPEGGLRPAPSARFVSKVRSSAGPATVPAGSDPFPVEEVRVSYENYVRDLVSNETVGFERVRDDFINSFDGGTLETVRVTQTFDVRPVVTDAGGAQVPVRHPLRGAPVSVMSESGTSATAELSEYRVEALGNGARIRPSRVLRGQSEIVGALWTAEDFREFDAYGNPTLIVSGNFNGTDIGLGAERRTKRVTYENRTDARWNIGLVREEYRYGYSEDVIGNATSERLLSQTSTDYDAKGSVLVAARKNVRAEACAGPNDDETTYEYWPSGLVKVAHEPNGRNTTTTYDAHNLYPVRVETPVGKMVGGVFTPAATILARTFETDVATGKQTRVTEPSGSTLRLYYDAKGRLSRRVLCPRTAAPTCNPAAAGVVTAETYAYTDTFPVNVVSTIVTDTGASYQRVTYFDGDGNVLAVVEGESTGNKSLKQRTRYDAFGRAREDYLPIFVTAFADAMAAPSGPRVTTLYDGFDRPRIVRRADGTTTSYDYEPRVTIETNPRLVVTQRTYDAFGDLVAVVRNPGGAATETSTHTVVRDGLGAVVRVVDGDGSVRRIERDGGGRIRYLTLPANASSSAKFSLCHDVEDRLVNLETPAGRVITTLYDELGRPLVTEGTDDHGLFVQTEQVYDEVVANGLGRLTATYDESGVHRTTYDDYGRPAAARYETSARVRAGTANVAAAYTTTFTYSSTGLVKNAAITGLPLPAEVRYTRDARGRVVRVESRENTTWTTVADTPAFDADDRLTAARFGNLSTAAWTYGPLTERLDAITYKTSAGDLLASVNYEFDENGNPKLEERRRQGVSGVHSQKIHSYDLLDRLISSESRSPAGNVLETYSYSPGGNLLAAGGDAYTYASPVTSQAATAVANTVEGSTRTLAYDDDGFLATDTTVKGGTTETRTLAFDPFGCIRDISKEVTGGTPSSAMSEYTCGSGGHVVARTTTKPDGTKSRRIDLAGIGEIRSDDRIFVMRIPVAGSVTVEDARSLYDGKRNVTLSGYLVNDARGSVLATTAWDSSAVITREAEYDAWGQKLKGYSVLDSPRHGFGAAEVDVAAGTYTFGVRTYDPTLRRWVSADPLLGTLPTIDEQWGEQLNLYQYAGNNPVRRVDLSGFDVNGPWYDRVVNEAAGVAYGTVQSFAPGGFLADLAGSPSKDSDFLAGKGIAQLVAGAFMTVSGAGQIVGGGGATVATDGAAAPIAVPVVATGAFVMAQGQANMTAGMSTLRASEAAKEAEAASARQPASESPPSKPAEPTEVTVSRGRHPESAQHIEQAQAAGQPSTLTIDRAGAAARRAESMKGTKPTSGMDRDEYPPAMFKEGGKRSSVRPITPGDNRGAGACIGAQCRELPNGAKVHITVTE